MKNVSNWKKEDAVSFIECCMIWIGAGFHPDTPMNGYLASFTDDEARENQTKLDKAFELLGDDIYECGMELGYKLGYYPRPDDQKFKLTVLFGENAIERFEEMGSRKWKTETKLDKATEEDGQYDSFEFDTEDEMKAFIQGMYQYEIREGNNEGCYYIVDQKRG